MSCNGLCSSPSPPHPADSPSFPVSVPPPSSSPQNSPLSWPLPCPFFYCWSPVLEVETRSVWLDSLLYANPSLTHNSPKYLEWNLASEKLEGFFSIKIRNFKLWEMPKKLNFTFSEGWYFLNYDNTELKRSSKIFFFCCRTASLGGSGLSHRNSSASGFLLMSALYKSKVIMAMETETLISSMD